MFNYPTNFGDQSHSVFLESNDIKETSHNNKNTFLFFLPFKIAFTFVYLKRI